MSKLEGQGIGKKSVEHIFETICKLDRNEIWTHACGQQEDFVGGPALPNDNSRWTKSASAVAKQLGA